MVADRAYSPGFFASTDRGASLFYFAAALPAVGFVHGLLISIRSMQRAGLPQRESEFMSRGREIDMRTS
jgi:hypothetical protein